MTDQERASKEKEMEAAIMCVIFVLFLKILNKYEDVFCVYFNRKLEKEKRYVLCQNKNMLFAIYILSILCVLSVNREDAERVDDTKDDENKYVLSIQNFK